MKQPYASPEPTSKGGRPAFRVERPCYASIFCNSGLDYLIQAHQATCMTSPKAIACCMAKRSVAYGDAGYQGIEKRADTKTNVQWLIAMRPGKRKALNKSKEADTLIDKAEKLKASIQAKVEHPFRGDQTPVWVCEGMLPRFEEEHGTADHVVCVELFVDGTQAVDGNAGMSASKVSEKHQKDAKIAVVSTKNAAMRVNLNQATKIIACTEFKVSKY